MEAPKCKICGHAHWLSEPHHGVTPAKALKVAKATVDSQAKATRTKPADSAKHGPDGVASRPSRRGGAPAVSQANFIDNLYGGSGPAPDSAPAVDERLDGEVARATGGKARARRSKDPKPASTVTAAVPKTKRGRPKAGFDKSAYQRELMRKKRAKAKGDVSSV